MIFLYERRVGLPRDSHAQLKIVNLIARAQSDFAGASAESIELGLVHKRESSFVARWLGI